MGSWIDKQFNTCFCHWICTDRLKGKPRKRNFLLLHLLNKPWSVWKTVFTWYKCSSEFMKYHTFELPKKIQRYDWSSQLYAHLNQLWSWSLNKTFRPERDSNTWPLRNRYSALPTELSNHLGAGHIQDGLRGQLVEYCTGITEGSNTVQAWIVLASALCITVMIDGCLGGQQVLPYIKKKKILLFSG